MARGNLTRGVAWCKLEADPIVVRNGRLMVPLAGQELDDAPTQVRHGEGLQQCTVLAVAIVGGTRLKGREDPIACFPDGVVLGTLAAVECAQIRKKLHIAARHQVLEHRLIPGQCR